MTDSTKTIKTAPAEYTISLTWGIWLYFIVALFLIYEMSVQTVPGIITTQLMQDLHLDAAALGFMSGLYFCSYTLMQIPAGILYDRFSVRSVLILPIIICIVGSYLFAVSSSLTDGSLARIALGFGSAFAYTSLLVVSNDVFGKKHFALMAGITQAVAAVGGMSGQLPLIPLVHHYGWRNVMEVLAVVGVVIAMLVWGFVRYPRAPRVHSAQTAVLASMKDLLKNKQTWIIAVYACALWAPMCVTALWGVTYMQSAHQLSETASGFANALLWVGLAVGSPLIGLWSDHIGQRRLPLIVSAIVGGLASSILIFASPLSFTVVSLLCFLIGVACSGQALSFAAVKENNPPHLQATALGFNNMAVVIAGFVFQPLAGKIIQWHWSGTLREGSVFYTQADYTSCMMILPVVYAIGLIVSYCWIRESIPKSV